MLSVIVPAYNEEKYIRDCLDSVFSQKEAGDFEVIVVDNNSSDKTASIVGSKFPQAKIITEPKKGVAFARNHGAKEARGDILFFIDADVALPPLHFKRILQKFSDDHKLVAASGPYAYDGGSYIKLVTLFLYLFLALPAEYFLNRFLNFGSAGIAGNMAVKKDAFDKIGGFDEKIPFYGDDTDVFMRLRKLGRTRFFFDLIVGTSGRRLRAEGVLRSLFRYILNILWLVFLRHPLNLGYKDIR